MLIPYYKSVVIILASCVLQSDQQDCKTWELSTANLILTCKIANLFAPVVFVSPGGIEVARCSTQSHRSPCKSSIRDDKIFQNAESNETIYILPLYGSVDVSGSWICKHSSISIMTNVSTNGELKSAVDVEIKGNVSLVGKSYIFTLSCFSCSNPYKKYVEFQVNDQTEDYIIFTDNRCHHKHGECNLTNCICSKNSNVYIWIYRTEQPVFPMKVSCAMRFVEASKFKMYRNYGIALFNGTDFTYIKTKPTIITEKEDGNTVKIKEESHSIAVPVGLSTMSILVAAVIIIVIKNKRKRKDPLGVRFRWSRKGQCDEGKALLGDDEDTSENVLIPPTCSVCQNLTSYAFCSYAKVFVCETCSGYHRSRSLNHNLVQIANIYSRENIATCSKCPCANPEYICIACKEILCHTCNHKCEHTNAIKSLVLIKNEKYDRSLSDCTDAPFVLQKCYEIKIEDDKLPVRMRGLAVLSENQIVVADYKHWSLKLYQHEAQDVKLKQTIPLKHEPRGMAGISNTKVAVTFAYQKKIAIIDVEDEKWQVFDMKKEGKPFSIAYHKEYLAVEFGEGEDGFIALLDMSGLVRLRTVNNNNLGFFTGNTIRLALDMNAKCFYVSAMGKQEISCINFRSKVVWKIRAPSPRGILVYRRKGKHDTTIIFASKTCNVLYQVNPKNGKKSIIEIRDTCKFACPRYIAIDHCDQSNFMVVELADNIIGAYKLLSKDQ